MGDEDAPKFKPVEVTVLELHTNKGTTHQPGQTYVVETQEELDSLLAMGVVSTHPPKPPE